MRICLVAHGFPPVERAGVENYSAALAAALARRGHAVRVFAPRRDARLPHCGMRREQRDGLEIHWIALNVDPRGPREMLDRPAVAREFGRFLERERPEVVHFQHVLRLGVGLIHEAARRGIPCLYTAHDYYAICHRYTLLRPDLAHCTVRGDSMACARCDLAASFLNRRAERLGDYQMGALPEQLEPAERQGLSGILADEPEQAGFSAADMDAACDLRRELDSERARAFAALDRILAPTAYLRDELVRGGIARAKIHLQPYGIQNHDLLELPPLRRAPRAKVRFGYLGGLSKQKGVHVLLEGFARARAPGELGAGLDAELDVCGGGTDADYARRLGVDAARVGARLRGPYKREELPGLLAGFDALVVPSIWVENYPIVIREAFSARRPVLASRMGALPESVRDGVDGLLFEPGDPDDLARALRRASEPGVLPALAAAIPHVKTVEEEADELLAHYAAVRDARAPARAAALPESLAGFVRRVEELQRLPGRELLERALTGIARLRTSLLPEAGAPEDWLLEALAGGTSAQTMLRDLRRENEWLSDSAGIARVVEGEEQRGSEAHLSRKEAQVRSTAELALQALTAQARLLTSELRPVLEGLAELGSEGASRTPLPDPGAPTPVLLAAFRARLQAFGELRRELLWRRSLVGDLEAELAWRRTRVQELETETSWRREVGAKQEEELVWRREQMDAQSEELAWRRTTMGELERDLAQARAELKELQAQDEERAREIAELQGAARTLLSEVEWRRNEMASAQGRADRGLLYRLLGRAALLRQIAAWSYPPAGGTP